MSQPMPHEKRCMSMLFLTVLIRHSHSAACMKDAAVTRCSMLGCRGGSTRDPARHAFRNKVSPSALGQTACRIGIGGPAFYGGTSPNKRLAVALHGNVCHTRATIVAPEYRTLLVW